MLLHLCRPVALLFVHLPPLSLQVMQQVRSVPCKGFGGRAMPESLRISMCCDCNVWCNSDGTVGSGKQLLRSTLARNAEPAVGTLAASDLRR